MPRPAPKKAASAMTYRDAYASLARIAAELESGEADLDRVLPLIEEAQAAYEVCRERIEALRSALGEEGDEAELDTDSEEESDD
ncbi:exodeoxyribonuclease VII small subunit [Deinococcus sp.]|uniref:exodeoxyribonuclease VII small subunit n=1 Tax=Deinococcus sp. TaxID=47478 RepID=UPI00286E5E54|nr:exodeoxyribonuclease VII small subunit [Deinococcus sp.]